MGVFDELKEAFRQAVENFRTELNRDTAGEAVDGLLREMRKEAIDAEAYLRRLHDDLERTRKEAQAEGREWETCRRRKEMARSIGDEETARVAGEFADKHRSRQVVLERKAEALQGELRLRKEEVAEMKSRLEEAKGKRDALAAQAGRTRSREALRDDTAFKELSRMEERVEAEARFQEAAEELGRQLDNDEATDSSGDAEAGSPVPSLDERLEALKRRIRNERIRPDDEDEGEI